MKIRVLEGVGGRGEADLFREVNIVNGKWVLEVKARHCLGAGHFSGGGFDYNGAIACVYGNEDRTRILGVGEADVELIPSWHDRGWGVHPRKINHRGYWENIERSWWAVSDIPFVVTTHRRDDDDHEYGWTDADWHQLHYMPARQVHKGELGQRPVILNSPQVAPSNITYPGWSEAKKIHWVRLIDLSDRIHLDPQDLLRTYAQFSELTDKKPSVALLLADGPKDVRSISGMSHFGCQTFEEERSFAAARMRILFPNGRVGTIVNSWPGVFITLEGFEHRRLESLWVTQHFANAVMRLSDCGYLSGEACAGPHLYAQIDACEIGAP